MRFLLLISFAAFVVVFNTGATEKSSPADKDLILVEEWINALGQHDTARWVALHSDSVVWTFPESGGRLEGSEQLRGAIDGFIAKYPDIQFEQSEAFASGDKVALEWREWGTDINTGKAVSYYFCGILTITGGKITEVHRYGGARETE